MNICNNKNVHLELHIKYKNQYINKTLCFTLELHNSSLSFIMLNELDGIMKILIQIVLLTS